MTLEELAKQETEEGKRAKVVLESREWRRFKRRYAPSLADRVKSFFTGKPVEEDPMIGIVSEYMAKIVDSLDSPKIYASVLGIARSLSGGLLLFDILKNVSDLAPHWSKCSEKTDSYWIKQRVEKRGIPFDKKSERVLQGCLREELLVKKIVKELMGRVHWHISQPHYGSGFDKEWTAVETNKLISVMNQLDPEIYRVKKDPEETANKRLFGYLIERIAPLVCLDSNGGSFKYFPDLDGFKLGALVKTYNTIGKCKDYAELKERFAHYPFFRRIFEEHAFYYESWKQTPSEIEEHIAKTLGPLNRATSKAFADGKSIDRPGDFVFDIWDLLGTDYSLGVVSEKTMLDFLDASNEKNYPTEKLIRHLAYNKKICTHDDRIMRYLTARKDARLAHVFERVLDDIEIYQLYQITNLDLEPFTINGEISEGIEPILVAYSKTRCGARGVPTILEPRFLNKVFSDKKVRRRIKSAVFDYKQSKALLELAKECFDAEWEGASCGEDICRLAFQKEKSESKTKTITEGLKKVKGSDVLSDFYSSGKVSDSKYSMLEKIAGLDEYFFEMFESNISKLLEGGDGLPKYYRLMECLGIKEKKKPKYVKNIEDIVKGRKKLVLREFFSNMDKLRQRIEQLKVDAVNQVIDNIYVTCLMDIVGAEYNERVTEWIKQKKKEGNFNDVSNAIRLYNIIGPNKSHLGTLLYNTIVENNPNKQLLEEKANVKFREEMEAKDINMEPWLNGYRLPIKLKNGISDKLKNTKETMAENISYCLRDILQNLQEVKAEEDSELAGFISYFSGLQLSSLEEVEACREELIAKRHELSKLKIDEDSRPEYKTALFHLSNLIKFPVEYEEMQQEAELKGKVSVYIERDPLKVLQMGNYFSDSCLAVSKMNDWSTVANAIDANDAVVYVEYNGEVIGRKLLKLDNDGKIIQHRSYTANPSLNIDLLTNIFVKNLAKKMGTTVGEGHNFKNRLVADDWYNDGQKSAEYFFAQKAS